MENYRFLVWNRVRILRTGWHTPTKISQQYPLGVRVWWPRRRTFTLTFHDCSRWTVLYWFTAGRRNENIALIVTDPDKRNTVEKGFRCLGFKKQRLLLTGASCVTQLLWHRLTTIVKHFRGAQRQFSENICSKDDLRSTIFGTFVVKFLACLPLLGFSNI